MRKLTLVKIFKYIYTFIDENNKEYNFNLEFIGVASPSLNDIIYLDASLIKDNAVYTFGQLNNEYGQEVVSIDNKEIIVIESKETKRYLQRYYG